MDLGHGVLAEGRHVTTREDGVVQARVVRQTLGKERLACIETRGEERGREEAEEGGMREWRDGERGEDRGTAGERAGYKCI